MDEVHTTVDAIDGTPDELSALLRDYADRADADPYGDDEQDRIHEAHMADRRREEAGRLTAEQPAFWSYGWVSPLDRG